MALTLLKTLWCHTECC